jgi:hypothetical protein
MPLLRAPFITAPYVEFIFVSRIISEEEFSIFPLLLPMISHVIITTSGSLTTFMSRRDVQS